MTKEEFIEATTDVWELPSERATRVGHPAPFPVELPLRLIELYTYEGDLVLDPFIGSGTTAAAALRSGRHYVGYDTESEYVRIAEQRVSEERDRLIETRRGRARPRPERDGTARARGRRRHAWSGAGSSTWHRASAPSPAWTWHTRRAIRTGRQWLFDFVGAFTTTNHGLRRADTLWKALGKAAVIHAASPEVPLVLLTTAAPPRGQRRGTCLALAR